MFKGMFKSFSLMMAFAYSSSASSTSIACGFFLNEETWHLLPFILPCAPFGDVYYLSIWLELG
nr:hypothetical protein [Perna perna]